MRYFLLLPIFITLSCSSPQETEIKMSYNISNDAPQNATLLSISQGKGKYLTLTNHTNSLCNTIYIEQQNDYQFKEYTIESFENDRWCKIHESANITPKIRLDFAPRYFSKVRLHIKRSNKLPHIIKFALYYRDK